MEIGDCIHWTGIQNSHCEAGVDYRLLAGEPAFGFVHRLPCHVFRTNPQQCEKVTCDQFSQVSNAAVAQDKKDTEDMWKKTLLVMKAIHPWRTKLPIGKQEVIECPVCSGQLHLSQASCNGHVHGKCETKGCVSWME